MLHDRVAEEAPTSLSYLTALEELTIRGEKVLRAANEYLYRPQFKRAPRLPVSLQVLRIDVSPEARLDPFWWTFDYVASASATIPVLELRVRILTLNIVSRPPVREGCTAYNSLPEGLSSLRLCSERIKIASAIGPDMGSEATAERELCLFFLLSPQSYTEFRVCAPDGGPPMAAPELAIGSLIDQQLKSTARFESLGALADAMRRTPEAQTLDIEVLQDEQCLRVTRL